MSVLLDTNVYSELRRGHARVVDRVNRAERVVMSVVVVAELLRGFHLGDRARQNIAALEGFLDEPWVELAPITRATADRYALLAAALRRRGRKIGANDTWIAAQALEHGADLVSFDQHFAAVDGIVWIDPDAD